MRAITSSHAFDSEGLLAKEELPVTGQGETEGIRGDGLAGVVKLLLRGSFGG